MTSNWLNDHENARLVAEIRGRLGEGDTNFFIFLGSGLSFGVDRGRVLFEHEHYDDGRRFPSWPLLIDRMRKRVASLPEFKEDDSAVKRFFKEQSPIDCAELFRSKVGKANYYAFLREQFVTRESDVARLTRSHHELTRLRVKTIFTTNFDELIELAFRSNGLGVRVSSTPAEFISHRQERSLVHLVKLNGSIDRPETTILSRMDFARARKKRIEMLTHLSQELKSCTFLFVGFSLSDPNFTLIHDEARLATSDDMPVRYLVQGFTDSVKESYLRSMGVNTISLDWWESLPQFLAAINPENDLLN